MPDSEQLSKPKFLFDENVDRRLEIFLKQQGLDIIRKSKQLSNGKLSEFSKSEKRIFVTNDSDFTDRLSYNEETIFSIVWLRISQRRIESSKQAFLKLVNETKPEDFEGNLITLYEDRFEISPLSSEEA
ncbi:DUF5615 family PIN-like protein [Candidatus Pacearchaeota archaeon]|nr:DUF5615 family PIN-like protein [Candidatus Pacearchaeota archaeon]